MKKIFILILAIIVLGVGWWLGTPLFFDKEVTDPKEGDDIPQQQETILVNHSFDSEYGVHSYSGTYDIEEPCKSWGVTPEIAESYPEQITLHLGKKRLDTDTPDEYREACKHESTIREFNTSFGASEDAALVEVFVGESSALFQVFEE